MRTSFERGRSVGRGIFGLTKFKQIFSNNKRKVLYEITGKISFEGEDLVINLLEFTCSGDREYKVQSKKAEERAKLESVVDCLAEVVVQVFNGFK